MADTYTASQFVGNVLYPKMRVNGYVRSAVQEGYHTIGGYVTGSVVYDLTERTKVVVSVHKTTRTAYLSVRSGSCDMTMDFTLARFDNLTVHMTQQVIYDALNLVNDIYYDEEN